MTILVGLLAPLSIGLVDHIGTNLGRRGRLLATVFMIYTFTGLSALVLAIWWGGSPTMGDLVLGGLSGVTGSLALVRLYRGYTTRGTGIIGPTTAVTGAIVPIAVDSMVSGLPSPVVGGGMVLGLIGVGLVSLRNQSGLRDMIALKQGLISGVLFGITATLLGSTGGDAGIWPVIPGRVAALATVMAMILIYKEERRPHPGSIPITMLIGGLAGIGLGSYTLAAQVNLAVAGLFFQMSFGVTVLFQVIFAGESTSPTQRFGFVVAAIALVMVILG